VIAELKEKGLLYRSETIRHTYPFCWRCETPLLYYVKRSWYIRTTEVKKSLLDGNAQINWYPEHIKDGRFGDWLENNVDWAFSRERYWGTPLPIWRCEACDAVECVGGVEDLKKRPGFSGWQEPPDLHRPYVDEMTFDCPQCGGKMKRVPEVIDCWFDSGAMPVAQYHYPFENEMLLEDGRFPADYICEAIDQTRGWFYSLHAISTLLFGRPCFQNVICLGHILDAKGEKMSKARGNVIEPWQVINKYGADPLRWYLFTSTSAGNVRRFAEEMVAEVTRRFLLTLWNVYSFFINYANIDNFVPGGKPVDSHSELDRWILSELNQLIVDVDEALDNYNPTEGGRKIESFVSDLSNWYVRRSRRRFWKSENDADKLAAHNTLYHCLVTIAKLMAPFTPFLAEELYRNLVCTVFPAAPESVHLADFPVADKDKIDKRVMVEVQIIKELSSLGRAARSKVGIKVRQPIARMMVNAKSEKLRKAVSRFASQIKEEVNVKEIEMFDDITRLSAPRYAFSSSGNLSVAIDTQITPELAAEGTAREIVRRLQTMRRAAGFEITDHIITYCEGDAYPKQVMTDFAGYIKQETLTERIIEGTPEEGAFAESYKLGGGTLSLAVKRLT
jgi:isoleucyl-tRNA synthetase